MLVIDPKISTETYIFHHVFLCRIPYIASMSIEYMKQFGIPSSGDKEVDERMSKQDITTMLPISEMAKYYSQGVNVSIVQRADVKDIYILITNHLAAWKRHIEKSINLGNAPMEDLIMLDEFANAVYSEAKFEFSTEVAQSTFMQHMSSSIRSNKNNFFKKAGTTPSLDRDGNVRIHSPEDQVYPERESMSDIFRNRRIGNKNF